MKTLRKSVIEPLEPRIAPATLLVTNGNNSGAGSLRQAILDANMDVLSDTIQFDLPSPYAVVLTSALPVITNPVTIDGYTQPNAEPNTALEGFNADIRVSISGINAPEGASGFVIDTHMTTIRGLSILGFRASAQTGGGHGIVIEGGPGNGNNVVEGCFIGLSPLAGFGNSGNGGSGVRILAGTVGNLIGGNDPDERNFIADNAAYGIELAADSNLVRGNIIGNAQFPNGLGGVAVLGFSGNVIGGFNPGESNTITGNMGPGVRVSGGGGNLISTNLIYANTGLGIDLGPGGVTVNDAMDSDTGANSLLNFPKITSAYTGTFATLVTVDYVTTPSTSLRIEFFSSAASDPTAYGEGERYLGSYIVTSSATGVVQFTTTLPISGTPGHFITATAISSNNDTSEFSLRASLFSAFPFLQVAPGGKSATYEDADGDLVTVKTTKGTLANNLFSFAPTGFTSEGAQLIGLNLTDAAFKGANVTITAKRGLTGDGYVNVGRINATNVNLGKVMVRGNLAEIDAGHGDTALAGLAGLTVNSLGAYSSGAPVSAINGNLGSLRVLSDIAGSSISVNGSISTVFVGGSLLANGTASSGSIVATGRIGAVTILGDFEGSGAFADGTIQSGAAIGAIKIGGDMSGAQILAAGDSAATTAAKALTIKSLTIGGSVSDSRVLAGYNGASAVNARSQIGLVKVKGNWESSDLVAGVLAVDGKFGNANDVLIAANAPVASRIAGIIIGGQAFGTFGGTDSHGFVAKQIGSLKVGTTVYKLGKTTQDDVLLGPTNDLRLHEVA